jgi:hypothetical protein
VRGRTVEDDVDERPNVLDTYRLSVEVSDDRDLILRGGGTNGASEEASRVGDV